MMRALAIFLLATLNSGAHAQSPNNLTYIAQYDCWGREVFRLTRNGPPRDCAKAVIAGFPSDTDRGQLHHGSPAADPFSLPKTSTYGNCMVSIDLNGEGPV